MDKPAAYLTISVDDGAPTDVVVAHLLDELELEATFYVPARNAERPVLSNAAIRSLGERFEVGAHTFHHAALPRLAAEECRREIVDGKAWVEDVIGKRVDSFCYPRGKFNARVAQFVAESGFFGARTCMQNLVEPPENPFLWGASTQAYSHPRWIQVRHAALEANWAGLVNYVRLFDGVVDWREHFALAAAHVREHGGIAHLYLHSWEIDKYDAWAELRQVLVDNREGLTSVTNGRLFKSHWEKRASEQNVG
jgi:peptidoglycan/xylan/chitin deacetylase (PgdA/CDA1 family)